MTSHNGAFASFVSLHPNISAHTKVARRRNADISLQSYFLAPKLIAILGRIAYKAEMWPIPPRLVVCISVCVGHDYTSHAKTDKPIEMSSETADSRWPNESLLEAVHIGATWQIQ